MDFTEFQLSTFNKVQSLQHKLEQLVDPSTFVLNPEIAQVMQELEDTRANCDHKWTNGICPICGAIQDLEEDNA